METGKLVLDVRQAAHALSISPWTIRRYITDGKLRPIRIGRRVLIEPSELQRLVEAGRKPRMRPRVADPQTEIERVCTQGVAASAK
jgi:excisionase family DNA binding protein